MAMASVQDNQTNPQRTHRRQGVLWKRRDVFKNKWRPRWFVLQPEEAVLTYYLLSRTDSSSAPTTISTPLRRSNNPTNNQNNINNGPDSTAPPTVNQPANPSMHSGISDLTEQITVSENPIDYDVVPRGAIYLAGCTITINDRLSLPQEGLYAFSIVPPNSAETECHLAARTEEARSAWVATLSAVCNSNAEEGDNGDNGGDGAAAADQNNSEERGDNTDDSTWKSLSPPEKLFDNVPEPLAAKLEQSLESYLALCEDVAPALHWTPIFQDRDGVSAFQRQDLHGRTIMKSTAVVPHHPKQLLNLLLDPGRRQDYETNIAISERLDVLSDHTFLDYYAFKAVWPTSPRDFAVALHWQTLRRQLADGKTEEALVIIALSCPEAENLKEPSAPHVRASLHASFYLLRLVPPAQAPLPTPEAASSSDQAGAPKCHMTRILSYDLGGSLPRNLATSVLMQQAGLLGILSRFLRRVEPEPEGRLSTQQAGLMDNECVIRDVVENIIRQGQSAMVSSARKRLNFDKSAQESDAAEWSGEESPQPEAPKELSLPRTAGVLLLPLLVYRVAITTSLSIVSEAFDLWFLHPSFIFLMTALVACRLVTLSLLGQEVPNSTILQSYQGGPITCNVNVDLKGVLRFIGMKKEERKERAAASKPNQSAACAEVSIVHIVAIALARAMQNHADCWNYRRVNLAFLFVDGFFRYPKPELDVVLALSPERLICLESFAFDNVQAVANAVVATEQNRQREATTDPLTEILSRCCSFMDFGQLHGRCLIILTKQDDHQASNSSSDVGGVEITTSNLPNEIDVLVTVGGIRLHRSTPSVGSPLRASPPKPILSLSVTINTASVLDTSKCNAFAEDLVKLIQFPELCDD